MQRRGKRPGGSCYAWLVAAGTDERPAPKLKAQVRAWVRREKWPGGWRRAWLVAAGKDERAELTRKAQARAFVRGLSALAQHASGNNWESDETRPALPPDSWSAWQ